MILPIAVTTTATLSKPMSTAFNIAGLKSITALSKINDTFGSSSTGSARASPPKASGRARGGRPPTVTDKIRRDFIADATNQLWLTDITEYSTREGKIYLCTVKDVFSNRIVGYSLDSRMKARLAVAALTDAINRRPPQPGLIVHSDRGSQFRSRKFRRALTDHGLT